MEKKNVAAKKIDNKNGMMKYIPPEIFGIEKCLDQMSNGIDSKDGRLIRLVVDCRFIALTVLELA